MGKSILTSVVVPTCTTGSLISIMTGILKLICVGTSRRDFHCLTEQSRGFLVSTVLNTFVLEECQRVLKPGGTLRLVLPDAELYLTAYSEIVRGGSQLALPYAEGDGVDGLYSPILSVNRIFRAHGHRMMYDFDLIEKLLERKGFVEVRREAFQTGRDPRLLVDSKLRAIESFYAEASKRSD